MRDGHQECFSPRLSHHLVRMIYNYTDMEKVASSINSKGCIISTSGAFRHLVRSLTILRTFLKATTT